MLAENLEEVTADISWRATGKVNGKREKSNGSYKSSTLDIKD